MYIKFTLPSQDHTLATHFANNLLCEHLQKWADQYQVKLTTKHHKYTLRVTFEDEQLYALFALTWNPSSRFRNYLLDYCLIEPMRRV